jgi:hypothetical protein
MYRSRVNNIQQITRGNCGVGMRKANGQDVTDWGPPALRLPLAPAPGIHRLSSVASQPV